MCSNDEVNKVNAIQSVELVFDTLKEEVLVVSGKARKS